MACESFIEHLVGSLYFFYTGSDFNNICNVITLELEHLNVWFALNKLSLNVSKTNYMVFTNKILLGDAKIVINNHDVERVQTTKFLGVIIDEKLTWKYHIAHISGKINKNISVIYKVKKVISFDALKTLYTSLILPYLTYCCVIWGNASKCNLNKVIVLQKRILRIIFNSDYREHTSPLFKRCKLLKFSDLVNINILIVMFKVYNNLLPENIQIIFLKNVNCHYITRSHGKFIFQYSRTNLKSKSVSVIGVKLWNRLSNEKTNITCLKKFKYEVKKSMYDMYV